MGRGWLRVVSLLSPLSPLSPPSRYLAPSSEHRLIVLMALSPVSSGGRARRDRLWGEVPLALCPLPSAPALCPALAACSPPVQRPGDPQWAREPPVPSMPRTSYCRDVATAANARATTLDRGQGRGRGLEGAGLVSWRGCRLAWSRGRPTAPRPRVLHNLRQSRRHRHRTDERDCRKPRPPEL